MAKNEAVGATDANAQVGDLGPLAWILDELRKSLDGALKSLRRFVREVEAARGTDLAAVDAGQLRLARQQLHQAAGALEMVGQTAAASVLRGMETAVAQFVRAPEKCGEPALAALTQANFALVEYLDGTLQGKNLSSVALFPQYSSVMQLSGADRIHPADLWQKPWRWVDAGVPAPAETLSYGPLVRSRLDPSVLNFMKTGDPAAAGEVARLGAALAAAQTERQPRIFWKIAAAFFEAVACQALVIDLHVKRMGGRVLLQYASLAKGEPGVSDRLAQDLLFFCSQAQPSQAASAPNLLAVRAAYGLANHEPVDYTVARFGRYDPSILLQARKRIDALKETWSAVSGGDLGQTKIAVDQVALVAESLLKLHPASAPLAEALNRAAEQIQRSGKAPSTEVAMEVATTVLYLEAVFGDLDPNDPVLTERTRRLADRLSKSNGGVAQPLELWMEELYRRISDRQTMGTVVGELRGSLNEAEKAMDQFFRNPAEKQVLQTVPAIMSQMRGVLSVLGIDQAAQAVLAMRQTIEQILTTEVDEERARATGTFERLANSLGALGFLIDMLNYQPSLVKKLFVFDAEMGELRSLMGRAAAPEEVTEDEVVALPLTSDATGATGATGATVESAPPMLDLHLSPDQPIEPAPAMALEAFPDLELTPTEPEPFKVSRLADTAIPAPALPVMAAPAAPVAALAPMVFEQLTPEGAVMEPLPDPEEDDLRDIFLEEAREVIQTGLASLDVLSGNPRDTGEQTSLRRAFHTLKGSSRMVELNEFGEAAWALEQLLNAWLSDQKPISSELSKLCRESMQGFSRWVEDIAACQDATWSAVPFRVSADAMRNHAEAVALDLTAVTAVALAATPASAPLPEPTPAPAALTAATEPADLAPLITQTEPVSERVAQFVPETVAPAQPRSAHAQGLDAQELNDLDFADFWPSAAPLVATPVAAPIAEPALEQPQMATLAEADPVAPQAEGLEAQELSDLDFADFWPNETPVVAGATAEPEAAPVAVTEPEFPVEMVFEPLAEPAQEEPLTLDLAPQSLAAAPAEPLAELEPLDWDSLVAQADASLAPTTQAPSTPTVFDEPVVMIEPLEALVESEPAPAFEPVQEPQGVVAAPAPATPEVELETDFDSEAVEPDEQIKVIDGLRIGIRLYNVFLNEADEWSRRLQTDVGEWALELHRPYPGVAEALAHGLSGSSGAVGFTALAELARAVEHAVERLHSQRRGTPEQAAILADAADDIRRLLHQFAAGFLQRPREGLLQALKALQAAPQSDDDHDPLDSQLPLDTGFSALASGEYAAPVPLAPAIAMPPAQGAQPVAAAPLFAELAPVPASSSAEPTPAVHADTLAQPLPPSLVALVASPTGPDPEPARAEQISVAAHLAAPQVLPSAALPVQDIDDELDEEDVIDIDLFPIFEEEAAELLPQMGAALRQWVGKPSDGAARGEVLRALHTLKGSARLAGAMRLGELSHRMESAIEANRPTDPDHPQPLRPLEPLLGLLDGLQGNFDALRQIDHAQAQAVPSLLIADDTLADATTETSAAAQTGAALPVAPVRTSSSAAPRALGGHAVRVRSTLLDRMLNQTGEVMITRSRLEAELDNLRGSLLDLNGNLTRLRLQLRDVELQSETQMQSRLALAKDAQQNFDPLEFDRFTRVQELTRMMAETVNDVATVQRNLQRAVESTEDDLIAQARQTRALQRDLLRTRMVEFEGISERLYRVVRQASQGTGKRVKLDISGGSIEMDRGVLDRMTGAFEHLLRNCVAHGVEDTEARIQAGKDPVGTITIELHQSGNDVSVEFRDDGAGLDLARIRTKALQQGLIASDRTLSDAEVADLIFLPGFSTAASVTELSGRGIGMDVVRAEVQAVGGRIETHTKAGQGSSFKMIMPLTTAVTQVVMMRSGSMSIGVPANLIELVRRVPVAELDQAYQSATLMVGGESVPFFWSGALLQSSAESRETRTRTLPVVIFRSAAQRVALHVDEVLGNQEVVVKNLGPQLARLPGLAGMSVLASGAVVLIYNPVALSNVYGEQVRQHQAQVAAARAAQALVASEQPASTLPDAAASERVPSQPKAPVLAAPSAIPLVLVVDDSITVRRVTQRMLQREGYRVALAADGLQALEKLQLELPAVVLSDIEMPRMDGFDLMRNIRADAQLRHLPVIMITSRIAEKHREHARELGVAHYLGKPFSEEELLSLVRRYASVAVEVA